jgi:hypothetical protein
MSVPSRTILAAAAAVLFMVGANANAQTCEERRLVLQGLENEARELDLKIRPESMRPKQDRLAIMRNVEYEITRIARVHSELGNELEYAQVMYAYLLGERKDSAELAKKALEITRLEKQKYEAQLAFNEALLVYAAMQKEPEEMKERAALRERRAYVGNQISLIRAAMESLRCVSASWRAVGTGDCAGRDIGRSPAPALPADAFCRPGTIAVCWDGAAHRNPGFGVGCTYKAVTAGQCTGGGAPGAMYECRGQ